MRIAWVRNVIRVIRVLLNKYCVVTTPCHKVSKFLGIYVYIGPLKRKEYIDKNLILMKKY